MSALALLWVVWSAPGAPLNETGIGWLVADSECVGRIGSSVDWARGEGRDVLRASCRTVRPGETQ